MPRRDFQIQNQTYTIDQAIEGQSPLTMYDSLAQIALRPDLRLGTIMTYQKQNFAGMLSQLMALMGMENRTVKTNPYYWTEYCQEETITVKIKKVAGAAANQKVATLDTNSMSTNGNFSRPRAGYRAWIKELKHQTVNLTATNKTVSGAHTVTLEGINGETIDLSKMDSYTLIIDTLRIYKKGDDNPITTHGLLSNPPALRKGFVQKFEDGIAIKEDEIDGYAYDVEFHVVKGINPTTGKPVDMWTIPEVMSRLQEKYTDHININTLLNQRDDVKQEGFDGLIPDARTQGSFSGGYDPTSSISFRQILFSMIRRIRKTNGVTDYIMAHDFGFGMDWTEGFEQLVNATKQNHIYSLFGSGGEGVRNFNWFEFKDFSAFNHHFRAIQIDLFDAIRYGAMLPNFTILIPAASFSDTEGKKVPPICYTNIVGQEPAKQRNMWSDDTRVRGERKVNFFIKHSWGMENYAASKMGILEKKQS